jgi:hypothetical protein
MKYSMYFKIMMTLSVFFLGLGIEACLETLPTLCACFIVISFILWFSGIMAPDSEKYSDEYNKKRKGL